MQLIKRVEINYLRSIYSASLDSVGDLNLFFGRNDSGKSNILRALNLFFNEEVDPGHWFDFDLDMSDLRKKKAAEAKGRQFVWIKVTFKLPPNYSSSLGPEVSVKKQWNRDGEMNTTFSPSFSGGKAGRLSRFLNEVDFTYIPAIKDLNVYADLIERMYSSASENAEMLKATQDFISAIGGQTEVLTNQLRDMFGAAAILSAPTDMGTLFRNLDFSHGDERHSLFKQKGDGIKARHLPELLRFINESEGRKKFYIWGFEEPENSLDLSAASEEAKRLSVFASRTDTQVFVTSHSPAFYLAAGSKSASVRRYFVEKQVESEAGEIIPLRAAESIDKIEDADRVMKAAGLMQLPFVIRVLDDQKKEEKKAKKELEVIRGQLEQLQKPTIFLEGKHDIAWYPKLLTKFGLQDDVDVKELKGTPSNTSAFVASVTESGGLAAAKTVFIFDNDSSGRTSFKNLVGRGCPVDGKSFVQIGERLSATLLPFERPEFVQFLDETGAANDKIKFPFELMFANNDLAKKVDEWSVEMTDWREGIHNDYFQGAQKPVIKMQKYPAGSLNWLFARMVPETLKANYLKEAFKSLDVEDAYLKGFSERIISALGV